MRDLHYDPKDALSIFKYSGKLLGHTLAETVSSIDPDTVILEQDGKGGLGVLVEKFFFGYEPNCSPEPDFPDAGVELKVSPLKKNKHNKYAIKERLVCDMIDYMEIITEEFENSRFLKKSMMMLIIFYLHAKGYNRQDLQFVYSVLWQISGKDLLIIKNDFQVIRQKIRDGRAHELSEGDTMYLGACRKGQKGQKSRPQPNSDILAPARAFSFKTAYMRTILDFIKSKKSNMASNLTESQLPGIELVTAADLKERTFEDIVVDKIMRYKGMDSEQIQKACGGKVSTGKHANYLALCRIFNVTSLKNAEEIKKSGIIVKTIRVQKGGTVKESMSFENINYGEILETDCWVDSTWYNIVTSRFLFVVFRETKDNRYVLDRTFFWTMPTDDLEIAEQYWSNIRENVLNDTLQDVNTTTDPAKVNSYWKGSDGKYFHVRPKSNTSADKHYSPVSGVEVPRKAYWFNGQYIKEKIRTAYGDDWNNIFGV